MTGGFYDLRRSKLKYVKIIRENKIMIHKRTAELEQIGDNLRDILTASFFFSFYSFI